MEEDKYNENGRCRNLLHAQPFEPFFIHMADGEKVEVAHDDFVAMQPSGRNLIVYEPDNACRVLDVMLITQLAVGTKANGNRKKKRK